MRLNPRAMERCLELDGTKLKFFHYISNDGYDPDTQVPDYTGMIVSEFADELDLTTNEKMSFGGLIDLDSRKFIVKKNSVITKGDEVLNDSKLEQFRIIAVNTYKDRKTLFANRISAKQNQH